MLKRTRMVGAVVGALLAVGGTAVAQDNMGMQKMEQMMSAWPMASKEAAMFMTKKYGPPAAMSSDMMAWGKTGPWKRTVVYRVEHPHEFPAHHTDVMQQWIDYKAVAGKYNDLARYDGSVVVERTAGEISARCDKEAANFLALNLADEIIRGKRSVTDARKMYGDQIMLLKAMKPAPYTEKLLFGPMNNTEDPDHPVAMSGMAGGRP
ncbi:MAG: hypothetical protein M3081_15625 [Gemmatimonadota bacterium]|nr:hypothetical protein [Gemmatimonadota bacterium]